MSDNHIIKRGAWNSFLLPLVTPNSATFFLSSDLFDFFFFMI